MAELFKRYFLAIIPPEPIYIETNQLKNHFKEKYASKAALNSPPHITLHMPFRWKEKKETLLIKKLSEYASTQTYFDLHLHNFRAFAPRVIYLDVVEAEALQIFQKKLERFCKVSFQLFNANRLNHAYHPHLTIAFRDLKKEQFELAWQEFKTINYQRSFQVKEIAILKHSGTTWEVLTSVCFSNT